MKKSNLFRFTAALLAALMLLTSLAACRNTPEPSTTEAEESTEAIDGGTTAPDDSEPASVAETESENVTAPTDGEETTTNLPIADEAELRCGVWWAVGDGIDSYYEICADGTGAVIAQDSGTGVGMNYQVRGSSVTFQMGAVDAVVQAELAAAGEDLTVTFQDGHVEFWSYMGNVTMNGFPFYSNEELCAMAKDYIAAAEGYTPEFVSAAADTEDPRTINIRLYDNLGDHNSTAAWYFVDRFTAKGTDLNGNGIDLTAAP